MIVRKLRHWFSMKSRLEREKASLERALINVTERQVLASEVETLRARMIEPVSPSQVVVESMPKTILEKAGLIKRLDGRTSPVQEMAFAILEEFNGEYLNTSQIAALIQDRFAYKISPATTSSAIRLLRNRGAIAKKPKSWLYTFVMIPQEEKV